MPWSNVTAMEILPHILLVDDDLEIRNLLSRFLKNQRFRVTTARNGAEARRAFLHGHYQLVILDLMLRDDSGLDIARWMRSMMKVPIVMLTAMGEEADKITGLELGADDYVTKPFNPQELVARIRAVLRRMDGVPDQSRAFPVRVYKFAGWSLGTVRRRLVNPDGIDVTLTGGEYDLLQVLLDRSTRVVSREMVLDLVSGRQAGPLDRSVDVAISRLRRKLEDNGRSPQLIKTVRGGGYILATTVEKE